MVYEVYATNFGVSESLDWSRGQLFCISRKKNLKIPKKLMVYQFKKVTLNPVSL